MPRSTKASSSSTVSSSSLGKRKQQSAPAPRAASPPESSSGSIHADFSDTSDSNDEDGDDEVDGLGELVDSEEDEFEEDRQNPSRVAMWEDDEGEGSEEEDDEEDAEDVAGASDEDDEERERQPVGSKDKGKGKAAELARLQNDLRALPLATLLKAQRNLPRDDASSSGSAHSDDYDDEIEADPAAQKKERVAEARRKLAELMRIKKGGAPETAVEEQQRKERERKVLQKRSDKHAPTEISSKRQVSRKRVVVEVEKVERRDPRFSSLSGTLDPHLHSSSYNFLPDMLNSELSTLQSSLKLARKAVLSAPRSERAEKEAEVERIENELGRVRTRREREARERREREALGGWKREEREKRKEGKGEWHLGDAEKKRLLATAKHTALLAQGGQYAVKKSMEKKIKKQDGKEKKSRPRGLGFGGDGGAQGGDRKRVKM